MTKSKDEIIRDMIARPICREKDVTSSWIFAILIVVTSFFVAVIAIKYGGW